MLWLPLGAVTALVLLGLGRRRHEDSSAPPGLAITPELPAPSPKTGPKSTTVVLSAGGWYTFRALAPAGMSQPESVSFIQEWGGEVASAKAGKRVTLQFNWGPSYDTKLQVPGQLGDFTILSVKPAAIAGEQFEVS